LTGVIVLWTPHSIASKNVRDEARLSLTSDKLITVLHGVTRPSFPFDRINGLPLDGWNGMDPRSGWTRLIHTIDDLLAHAGAATAGSLKANLAAREAAADEARRRAEEAESSFQ
jgi:hypothetical protein